MAENPEAVVTILTCPSCGAEIALGLEATVPQQQTITVTIRSESKYISAEMIGGTILNQTEILQSVAARMGIRVAVFISKITTEDHVVDIEFTVATVKQETDEKCQLSAK